MKNNRKVKIHVKNNHWAPGSFPTDAEGEKNFTITKDDFDRALEKFPEVKEKIEIFIDWDEENFNSSMASSDILLTWNFPTSNLKKIAKEGDPVIIICRSGKRSGIVSQFLDEQADFTNVYNASGGMLSWVGSKNKTVKPN